MFVASTKLRSSVDSGEGVEVGTHSRVWGSMFVASTKLRSSVDSGAGVEVGTHS